MSVRLTAGLETENSSARTLMENVPGRAGGRVLTAVRRTAWAACRAILPSAGTWNEACQPVEVRHDQRVPFAHGGKGQHYPMAGLNLLAAIAIRWNPSISAKRSDSRNTPR